MAKAKCEHSESEKFEIGRDILSLIGKRLTKTAWRSWTEKQRVQAIEYAGSCHCRAHPKEPKHVKALKEFQMDDF